MESEKLKEIIEMYCEDCTSPSNTEDCKKYCTSIQALKKALNLLEKVESMEYQYEWYDDEKSAYERGYNACLEELKKIIGGNDDGK